MEGWSLRASWRQRIRFSVPIPFVVPAYMDFARLGRAGVLC
jgi:hypothetical protein